MDRSADHHIAAIAARQRGVFSRIQARAAGLSADQMRARVAAGRWEIVHPGVYLVVGAPATYEQRVMAACLHGGDGIVASRRTAASLWGMPLACPAFVQVTGPSSKRLRRRGIEAHRTDSLTKQDITTLRSIPITAACRTVIDCAADVHPRQLGAILDDARRRGLVSLGVMARRVDDLAASGRDGIAAVRSLLADRDAPPRSVFESRLRDLLAGTGLPPLTRNWRCPISDETFFLDFAYPDVRICIEADSEAFHLDLATFRNDRRRQNLLILDGWTVLRFTWHDLRDSQARVTSQVGQARALRVP